MVYILLGEGFEEAEAIVPGDLLRRAGVEVAYVGLEGPAVTGSHGITVTADLTLEQVKTEDMEMLVLPGGLGGVASIQMDLFATALIQKARDLGCWLAAICAAPPSWPTWACWTAGPSPATPACGRRWAPPPWTVRPRW